MFTLFADVVAVFTMCTTGILNVRTIKALLYGLEHHSIFERSVNVGMRRTLVAYFITHTPI